MPGFPLATEEELAAVQERWDAGDPVLERLRSAAAGLLVGDSRWSEPMRLSVANNLFQIQTMLIEAALVHRLGGDERYAELITRLVAGLGDEQRRRERLPTEPHLALVLVGLCVAAELSPQATDPEPLRALVAELGGELWQGAQTQAWGVRVFKRNAWNHGAVCFSALGCAGLTLGGPEGEAWVDAAQTHVRLFMRDGISERGLTREGLSLCGFVMRNMAPFVLALRNLGRWDYRDPEANPFVPRLRRIPNWYATEVFPSGRHLQNAGDSYWEPGMALGGFLPMFGALAPERVGSVWDALVGRRGDGSAGEDGERRASSLWETALWPPAVPDPPLPAPEFLADNDVGYVTDGGASRPGHRLALICGRYVGGIHDQSDNGALTLFADGVPLLIDSGAANRPEEGSASASGAHNLVMVDGRGQLPAGAGTGVSAELVALRRSDVLTIASMDLAASYNQQDHNPLAHAVRHVLYVREPFPYVLVIDDFRRPGDAPALYERRWHTPITQRSKVEGGRADLRIAYGEQSCAVRIQALDDDVTIDRTSASTGTPPFASHEVWTMARTATHAVMATLILPMPADLALTVKPALNAQAGRVQLSWRLGRRSMMDVVVFQPGTATAPDLRRDRVSLETEYVLAAPPPLDRDAPDEAPPHAAPPDADADAQEPPPAPAEPAAEDPGSGPGRTERLERLVRVVREARADPGFPTPPERGIVMGGPSYRDVALEFLQHFVTLADLDPSDDVLDAGCGGGRMAAALLPYLDGGSYVGFDVHAASVDWCNEAIAPRSERFTFEHVDLFNEVYNPAGTGVAAEHTFPYEDGRFDVVLATSLATHMHRAETARFLQEFGRVLRPGGSVFLTAYLLTADATLAMARPGAVRFDGVQGDLRLLDPERPMAGVAVPEEWLRADARRAGLTVDRVAYGTWSTLRGLAMQDILVLRRDR